jgi:hypothetical protein
MIFGTNKQANAGGAYAAEVSDLPGFAAGELQAAKQKPFT